MAEIADKSVFAYSVFAHGKFRRYPWAEWTDGQVRILTRGEDFRADLEIRNLQTMFGMAAKRVGKVPHTTKLDRDRVAIVAEIP